LLEAEAPEAEAEAVRVEAEAEVPKILALPHHCHQRPFLEKPGLGLSWTFETLFLFIPPIFVPIFISIPFCSRSYGFLDFFYWTIIMFMKCKQTIKKHTTLFLALTRMSLLRFRSIGLRTAEKYQFCPLQLL
jgi:hypothetical protein